jgi:hypothetical protein
MTGKPEANWRNQMGVSTSLRLPFAFLLVNERYRDLTSINESST